MNRRQFFGSVVVGMLPFAAGCVGNSGVGDGNETTTAEKTTLLEKTDTEDGTTRKNTSAPPQTTEQSKKYTPLTNHYFSDTIAYEHNQLRLRSLNSAVQPGGTIKFEVTNTGDSSVTLGCKNPWTLQKRVDAQWRDVIWTSTEYYLTCATMLPAGESTTVKVTVSRPTLETQSEEVRLELSPGQYRFVLLSTDPYLAVDFRIRTKITDNSENSSTDTPTSTTMDPSESASSSTSAATSSSTTEKTQSEMCTTTPVTKGTAVYEGTTFPCNNIDRTRETRTQ
jgi:hypothetical protein